ncbi:PHP domain-containing protein [Cytobacillus sp. FSL M8-0252]|uniref:PHP domain-containing protein n=1 Tax=unclassified Cytobacillus TaxID=2675268 RepID=UPI0030FA4E29
MMKADLHVHSGFSDGADSIQVVMEKAAATGITHISIVDHDTVKGQGEALTWAETYQIQLIPGIEISAFDFKRNRKVHVLGYHYDANKGHILALCNEVLKRRQAHSIWQIGQIQQQGIHLSIKAISQIASPSETIYKQHIMAAITSEPYDSEAYKKLYRSLFKGGGVAAGDIAYVDVYDAIRAIKADGGFAVIAHPGQLDSYDLIEELVDSQIGLDGIERNHPDHSEADHQRIDILMARYGLLMTGGSDYHGAFGSSVRMGDYESPINRLLTDYLVCK